VPRRRSPVALFALLAAATMVAPPTLSVAQSDPQTAATLTLDPVDGGTVTGLAVLTARDADTAANVLAVGAPAGAIAVIHGGTCAAIDPAPVGLLGDVGTTGQLAVTVPLAFASIADGTHVVVLHPGLDLGTTLACGAIPAIATGSGIGSPAPVASGDRATNGFMSSTFGFRVDWSEPWQRIPQDSAPGIEGVRLGNGTSEVGIAGVPVEGGDATACIRAWEGRLLDQLRTGGIADLVPATAADGTPVTAGDASTAGGAFQFRLTGGTHAGTDVVEQADCRRLSDAAVLEITSDIPLAERDGQTPLVDALVDRVVVSGAPAVPIDVPATPAVATPPPTPATTAAPTTDAACVGMDAWVRDTLARFDELKRIGDELNTAMSAGMQAYAQQLADDSLAIQQLLQAQQQGAVPAAVKDIQPDLVTMFQKLADAYDLMSQAYTSGNTGLLQQGLSAAGEAQTLATTTRSAIRRAATPCGINVPAA
jgi:hypothetical protein